jgi:hypothetical protein
LTVKLAEKIAAYKLKIELDYTQQIDGLILWWGNWLDEQTLIVKTEASNKLGEITVKIQVDTDS